MDGKAVADSIRTSLKADIGALATTYPGFRPHSSIIQVGNRDDSSLYVHMKEKTAHGYRHALPLAPLASLTSS
ncbi:hypothetical protein BCR44DRAFT_48291 [Catenaria anguillulae PL171]|uniref:Tetrahydrofolate dehydrogenase/cyclohydrolase catalytic domain-containing protein n=1 Tax=Catenaria anguillulae PL171 TaxID=765915 RepID=A0A1Y2HAN7_9FUNG|nr:hypothetical protein BCR44DRAFT_48291 [Catenaria anguillulae PL171]